MGGMQFQIHPPELLQDWSQVHRAYLEASDGRVYPTRVEVVDNTLVFRKSTAESCKLYVSWPIPERGRPVLSTMCLRKRDEAYLLPVELARGKILQLRDQAGAWELAGCTSRIVMLPNARPLRLGLLILPLHRINLMTPVVMPSRQSN